MESQYQTLATILLAACPAGIDRAWIEASVNDGHVRAQYWYEKGEERAQPKVDSMGSFQIAKALSQVHDAWPTDPKWSKATFTLHPDGRFDLDVADGQ